MKSDRDNSPALTIVSWQWDGCDGDRCVWQQVDTCDYFKVYYFWMVGLRQHSGLRHDSLVCFSQSNKRGSGTKDAERHKRIWNMSRCTQILSTYISWQFNQLLCLLVQKLIHCSSVGLYESHSRYKSCCRPPGRQSCSIFKPKLGRVCKFWKSRSSFWCVTFKCAENRKW